MAKIQIDQVKKAEIIGILGDVRQRLGAESETDNSVDDEINSLSNHELIAEFCGFQFGDNEIWNVFKSKFDRLEGMDK